MTPSKLHEWLARHSMGGDSLAHLIGVTPGAVKHWLAGRRDVPLMVCKLLWLFDNMPDTLVRLRDYN